MDPLLGIALGVLVAAVAITLLLVRLFRRRDPVGRLKADYLKRLHLPPEMARQTMNRQLDELMDRVPGKSPEWYLRSLIASLKKDRR